MVSGVSNAPIMGISASQSLNQIKSEIAASGPQTRSGAVNPNEFNVVENTNPIESKPALQQNNLSAGPPSPLRGSALDISV